MYNKLVIDGYHLLVLNRLIIFINASEVKLSFLLLNYFGLNIWHLSWRQIYLLSLINIGLFNFAFVKDI